MRIALCDDEPQVTGQLERLIRQYAFDRNYEMSCDRFTGGDELLKQDKYDLYFLDYRMDGMDGIKLAKALGEKFGGAVTVCYLTNYDAVAAEIINQGVHADGFLKKPVDPSALNSKLDQFYRMSFSHRFELRKGKRFRTVYARDIIYAEASGKQVLLHMSGSVEPFNYLLSELEEILPDGLFFRIHRSYIINLQYVDSYDAKSVTLRNGETLPIKNQDFRMVYRRFMFLFNE